MSGSCKRRFAQKAVGTILLALVVVLCVRCGNQEEFTQQATTQYFLQDFNPENIDVLWVVNDRSPMYRVRDHLISEAKKFFLRLDSIPSSYQMAVITADMRVARGQIQPTGNPFILKKNVGTVDQRSKNFAAILSKVINLNTDYEDKGLEAAWTALNLYFQPRENIPLVIVFISDSDDHSDPRDNTAVDVFAKRFLGLKKDKKDLLRVYSINYLPLNGAPKSDANRCATLDNADIDVQTDFDDRYFKLAKMFGGVSGSRATGDLCQAFAEQIDLSGLRAKELPRAFKLERKPVQSSIIVSVVRTSTRENFEIPWTYNPDTNEIVFETIPPDGTTIQVTYHPSA